MWPVPTRTIMKAGDRVRVESALKGGSIIVEDWLLAEAVRLREERVGRRGDDRAAVASASTVDQDLAARLAARARALPGAGEIVADIERLRRFARRVAVGMLSLAALAGILAARASIAERQVDILVAAAGLLLLPTLTLVLWVALFAIGTGRKHSASLSGTALASTMRRLGPRVLASDHAAEVALAGASLLRTGLGRWLASVLAHAMWMAYSLAALATLALFFSIAQYDLIWGTTILTDETVVELVSRLALLPAALGLMPPPEPGWILAGREGAMAAEVRALWAHFLLSMIAVYGLLPRLILAGFSAVMALMRARRLTLDTDLPGYLRLAGALAPQRHATEHGDPATRPEKRTRQRHPRAAGRPVLIGIELENTPWPPLIPGIDANALGRADDRAGRRALLSALEALQHPPPALLVVCSMLRTPDTGTERFINRAADAARAVPVLIIDESGSLEARGDRCAPRVADWEALAERTGGEAVVLDLTAPDAAALARARNLVEGGADGS